MLLTKKAVAETLAVHPNTIDNLRRDDPTFPRPIPLSERTLRWRTADIERWVDALAGDTPTPARRAKGAAERLGS